MIRNLYHALRVGSLLAFLLWMFNGATAQTGTIRGTVIDGDGRPIHFANVLLLKSTDSSLIKGTTSDISGKYYFDNIKKDEYFIKASFTGKEHVFTKAFKIFSGSEIDLATINLGNADAHLKTVTVTAKKPMFEQKVDRMIINVKSSITSTGGTALDILEKSPGVTVNRQSNSIAINGKNGVTVMINGKISYMPMDALVQLLAGISAGSIEKIELITTPPSKYDAGGNAGFINIVLIDNPYTGFSGSYFLTAGAGKRALGAGGINFNYRSAKINLFGNYALNYDHTIQTGTGFTQFNRLQDIITNTTYSYRDCKRMVQNLRIGLDYQLDSATIIGVLTGGYINHWSMVAESGATIQKNNIMDTIIRTVDDPEFNRWTNIMTNLNFQHSFKPGKVLFFDANYIYFKDNNPNNYSTDYYSHIKDFLFHEDSRSGKITPINFRVFSSDYTTPVGNGITLDAGVKLALSKFNNDVSSENFKQGRWVKDHALSANYLLKENITAAYTSINMKLDSKISITAGLRYEYTTSNLGTTETANIIDRKYGELFPSFQVTKKWNNGNSIYLSYARRITRPTFNDLAPFTVFFDPKTFYSGNPALQPAIANSVQAGYSFGNSSFTLSYTYEANTINSFYFQTQRIDTVNNLLYLSARNFNYQQLLSANFSLPVMVTPWWNMQNNINGTWRQVSTTFEKTPVLLQNVEYNINTTQRIALPENFSVEITGLYSSSSFLSTVKRKPFYQVDAGLQKKLGNKNDILRFTANDIFNSGGDYRFDERLPIPGAMIKRTFQFGLAAYKLTYTHNFGNHALKGKRERTTGAEDELKRVRN